jgi:sugar transferase (PEP-CTERM system associated)
MIRLLRDLVPASVLTLLVSELILVFSCFVAACLFVLEVDTWVFLLHDGGIGRILIVVASVLIGLYFHDLYEQIRVRSRMLLVQQLCQIIGIAFLAQALLSYFSHDLMVPRWVMMLGGGLSLVVLLAWRLFYGVVVLRALGGVKLLFLGHNSLVEEIEQYIAGRPELGIEILGHIEDVAGNGPNTATMRNLGSVESLRAIVEETKPDRIVVGMRERRQRLPVNDLLDLRFAGIRVEEAATTFEATCGRVSLKDLRPGRLIFAADLGPRPGRVLLQALYSTLLGLVGFVMTAPVMLIIALVVRVSSAGPVLYKQKRVGLNGRLFMLYKFRSMHEDAEAETGAVWATRDDPRVTRLGRWLRRLRLDELPQFLNVLRGEMAIVGPRPERPEFVKTLEEQIPFYRQRHCVKPGITGWAQINHKYGNTLEDTIKKLEYDLYYIKNLSPALDAYIVFHTLKTMLLSRGAH